MRSASRAPVSRRMYLIKYASICKIVVLNRLCVAHTHCQCKHISQTLAKARNNSHDCDIEMFLCAWFFNKLIIRDGARRVCIIQRARVCVHKFYVKLASIQKRVVNPSEAATQPPGERT